MKTTPTFTIHFGPVRDFRCDVFASSAAGEENEVFEIPRLPDWSKIGEKRHHRGGSLLDDTTPPRVFGKILFDALFHGRLALLYERTKTLEREGLNIVVKLNPRNDGYDVLRVLPWEFLCDSSTNAFLAELPNWNVSRYLTVPVRNQLKAQSRQPDKVLLIAAPESHPYLADLPRENHFEHVQAAYGTNRVIPAPETTKDKLPELLRKHGDETGIIHILAHGSREALHLGEEISGDRLAKMLIDDHPCPGNIKLIVFAACNTGDQPETRSDQAAGGVDYYGGPAAALVLAGFPEVIAMSHRVDNIWAGHFFKTFYEQLAEQKEIATCLSHARAKALAKNDHDYGFGKVLHFKRSWQRFWPIFNWSFFKKAWTIIALAELYLAVSIFSQVQLSLGLPSIPKTGYSAAVFGLVIFAPLFTLFLMLSHYHITHSRGTFWHSRIPEFWGVSWDSAAEITKYYQTFSLFIFFIIPGYLQGAFFNKYINGTAYYYPKNCSQRADTKKSPDEAILQELKNQTFILKDPPVQAYRQPCWIRLTYEPLDHFRPSRIVIPGDSWLDLLDGSHDYVHGEHRVTYFPLFSTYGFALHLLLNYLLLLSFFRRLAQPSKKILPKIFTRPVAVAFLWLHHHVFRELTMKKILSAIIIALIIIAALANKNYKQKIRKFQYAQMKAQETELYRIADYFAQLNPATPNPDIHFFLSKHFLNKLLEETDGTRFDLPNTTDTKLLVKNVRIDFDSATPIADLNLAVVTANDQLIETYAQTQLNLTLIDNGTALQVDIGILALVPKMEGRWYNFAANAIADQIMQSAQGGKLQQLLRFKIPIDQHFQLELSSAQNKNLVFRTEHGRVHTSLSLPAQKVAGTWALKQWFFLSDGLHVLLDVHWEAP